jgi:hypothetical protein
MTRHVGLTPTHLSMTGGTHTCVVIFPYVAEAPRHRAGQQRAPVDTNRRTGYRHVRLRMFRPYDTNEMRQRIDGPRSEKSCLSAAVQLSM